MFHRANVVKSVRQHSVVLALALCGLSLSSCGAGQNTNVPSVTPQQSLQSAVKASASATSPTGIIFPMYEYPSSSSIWAPIISAKKANPNVPIVVIANVNSGPGSAIDANYAAMIPQLLAAGVTVIGYVNTSSGSKATSSVESQISKWNTWYKVNGIFLDGMPNVTGKESYYSTLTQYAKSLGMSLVVGDPGTDTVASYIGTVDTLVTYNNAGYPALSFLSGGWHASYAKSNFAFISYGDASLNTSFEKSAAPYVQYEFMTNLSAAAPFSGLPSYFASEVAALASPTPVPTVTPTAKPTATPTAKPTTTPSATPTVKPTAVPTAVAATKTSILIPLYMYPSTSSTWSAAITAKKANPNATVIAVVNADSGPGSSLDSNYASAVANLKAAGVTVFGYIHTSYGAQSVASLESQMSQWVQWYGPSGMFFDEMANTTGYESYYTTLTKYAKSLGMTTTIGNPGDDTIPSYIGTVDTIVIYENSGMPTLSFLSGGWHASYAKSNFAFIAYGVSSLNSSLEQSEAPYVAYEYITSGTEPNPYNLLPSYLGSEVTNI